LVVIGGGSGGIAAAKRAASYGASVILIEGNRYGGTCVNVGCVPKKVMFNASHVMETIKQAKEFGITVDGFQLDWSVLKRYRDRYIQRLNGIYESGLDKLKITRIAGYASFVDKNTLKVRSTHSGEDQTIRGNHILIATGGKPSGSSFPGVKHTIDSDGFFQLEQQPKKVAVLGAGYIAVELAGVFHELGTETTLFVRRDAVLREFDPMLSQHLSSVMSKHGPTLVTNSTTKEIIKENDGTFTLHFENGKVSFQISFPSFSHVFYLLLSLIVFHRF
jgi:glutathione reductase (NADPH)